VREREEVKPLPERDYRNRDDGFYRGRDDREQVDRFESRGPGEYRESTEVFLRPGEYDEVAAREIDYETMENILIDWLAADGRVEVVSPVMARQRLTDQHPSRRQRGEAREVGLGQLLTAVEDEERER
jgi:hypothetical protein